MNLDDLNNWKQYRFTTYGKSWNLVWFPIWTQTSVNLRQQIVKELEARR